jgi:LDH2 family malate/lactate/ureidoglycolate dehydrogenase
MPNLGADELREMLATIHGRNGVEREEAEVVAWHQVEANLVGHDSHGVCPSITDPARFLDPVAFQQSVEDFSEFLLATPPAEGFTEILYPGQLEERTKAERERSGVPVDDQSWTELNALPSGEGS